MSACFWIRSCAALRPDSAETWRYRTNNQTGSFAHSENRSNFSWAPGKVIGGSDYLLEMVIPNTYFHLTMAYSSLRHNGVDVGKMDFLDPISPGPVNTSATPR